MHAHGTDVPIIMIPFLSTCNRKVSKLDRPEIVLSPGISPSVMNLLSSDTEHLTELSRNLGGIDQSVFRRRDSGAD